MIIVDELKIAKGIQEVDNAYNTEINKLEIEWYKLQALNGYRKALLAVLEGKYQ